ncbi:hypothetical protein [Mycobacterium sp.]|uniref:hypothetical protein n=1 Tax=Mycobacterium sp. TaxID=1785 RepID=UPI003C753C36
MNGGPQFPFTEAVSFMVNCTTGAHQAQVGALTSAVSSHVAGRRMLLRSSLNARHRQASPCLWLVGGLWLCLWLVGGLWLVGVGPVPCRPAPAGSRRRRAAASHRAS